MILYSTNIGRRNIEKNLVITSDNTSQKITNSLKFEQVLNICQNFWFQVSVLSKFALYLLINVMLWYCYVTTHTHVLIYAYKHTCYTFKYEFN